MKYFTRDNNDRYSFAERLNSVKPIPSNIPYEIFYKEQYDSFIRKVRTRYRHAYEQEAIIDERRSWCFNTANRFLPSSILSQINDFLMLSWNWAPSDACDMIISWSDEVILQYKEMIAEYKEYISKSKKLFPLETQIFINDNFHDFKISAIENLSTDVVIRFNEIEEAVVLKKVSFSKFDGIIESTWKFFEIYLMQDGKVNLQVLLELGEFEIVCENIYVTC